LPNLESTAPQDQSARNPQETKKSKSANISSLSYRNSKTSTEKPQRLNETLSESHEESTMVIPMSPGQFRFSDDDIEIKVHSNPESVTESARVNGLNYLEASG